MLALTDQRLILTSATAAHDLDRADVTRATLETGRIYATLVAETPTRMLTARYIGNLRAARAMIGDLTVPTPAGPLRLQLVGDADDSTDSPLLQPGALPEAGNEVKALLKEHDERFIAAIQRHVDAEHRFNEAVCEAEETRDAARNPKPIEKNSWYAAAPITLYEDRLIVRGKEHPITQDVSAFVETAGNIAVSRRHTLTRFALMGGFSLFAPKETTKDERELYLLVEGPDWAELLEISVDRGRAARDYAMKINLAARTAEQAKADRVRLIAEAEQNYKQAVENRGELDACAVAREQARRDTCRLGHAVAQLDQLLQADTAGGRAARRAGRVLESARRYLDQLDAG